MKILIIGGHGTIGRCVVKHLSKKHNVIIAGRTAGDETVDITDSASIESMFEKVTELDAVICIAGEAKWDRMDTMTEEDYYIGIRSKLMGQVNLARIATKHLNAGGSIVLSTGILADDPVEFTTSAAMVNGAINSFTKAAALEMTNGLRINVVSSGLVEDSAVKYADYFPGHDPVPMSKIVNAYVKCVEGKIQGEVVHVRA
jgi:NAD(P)-dependent dehydrogenase (short-subunit alcohol dehydrogenase family)